MVRFRRVSPLFLIYAILLSIIPCRAAAPECSAEAFVLMDADSGRVLYSRNENREMAIASTTKIMTALTALEYGSLDRIAEVKRTHLQKGSSMYLEEGEKPTLEALLYGLLLPSGNDAAECIADHCGGRENFVRRMNEKAREYGLSHTAFMNPSGLDEEGHYSSAEDMARIASAGMKNPVFRRIVSTKTAHVGNRTMTNHNKLLFRLSDCAGIKTGYTDAAGRALVSCCERDGRRLIAVTLNDPNDWKDHAALYEVGFAQYAGKTLISRGKVCAHVNVLCGERSNVAVAPDENFFCLLADGEETESRISLPEMLPAPVTAGTPVGELVFRISGGPEIGRVKLVCTETIKRKSESEGLLARLFRIHS